MNGSLHLDPDKPRVGSDDDRGSEGRAERAFLRQPNSSF